ncbi:hypothetical protein D3C72_1808620 [compost metagenome]
MCAQADLDAGAGHAAPGGLDHDVAAAQRRHDGVAAAPDHGAQPRVQLVKLEWLDDVVVRARVQALDPFAQAVPRGQDQDRRRVVARAQLLQDGQSAAVGQSQIQQHGAEAVLHQCQARLGHAAHPVRVDPRLIQAGVQGVAQHGVVFD